jgi:endonuclease/exonuclease/phosphatase family metal-dependent hydrolase
VRALTWNLHGAGRPDLSAVAALLRETGADVVALQEVRRAQADRLARELGVVSASWTLKHQRYGPFWRRHDEGLALLLPEKVSASSLVLTPDVSTWTSRRRVAQVADLPGLGLRVINTHLDAHDAERRAPQARTLGALVRDAAPRPCVVLGDLNARVDENGVFDPLLAVGLRDAWDVEAGAASTSFTSPASAPGQRIDHVLVSASVDVHDVRVPTGDWARWSDHLPVLAELELVPGD